MPSCREHDTYCPRCDVFFGIDGVHVLAVERGERRMVVTVETAPRVHGCPRCGVVAVSHGRRDRLVHDMPCFGAPVTVIWRKRTFCCPDPDCPVGTFSERCEVLVRPRGKLTERAIWWAIEQLRRENASVQGLARRLGVDWHTVWKAVKPVLDDLAADESRFAGVRALGVDEHLWHHTPHKIKDKGPKEMTGTVDLTRDEKDRTRSRLRDPRTSAASTSFSTSAASRGSESGSGRPKVAASPPSPFPVRPC